MFVNFGVFSDFENFIFVKFFLCFFYVEFRTIEIVPKVGETITTRTGDMIIGREGETIVLR